MRLTPKQAVLKVHKAAFSYMWAGGDVTIQYPFLGGNMSLACAHGYVNAWKAAWETVKDQLRERRAPSAGEKHGT